MENYTYEELYHWGIPGMKWGVRRYQNKDGTLTKAGQKRYAKEVAKLKEQQQIVKNMQATRKKTDALEAKKKEVAEKKAELQGKKSDDQSDEAKVSNVSKHHSSKPKKVKDMTDEELTAAINRMKLEDSYNEYMSKREAKTNANKGKDFVGKVLAKSGENIATQVSTYAMGKLANKFIEWLTDEKDAINPKKGQKDK